MTAPGEPDVEWQTTRVIPLARPGWTLIVETDLAALHLRMVLSVGERHHTETVVWFRRDNEPDNEPDDNFWWIERDHWPNVIAHVTEHVTTGRLPGPDCPWIWT